MQDIKRKKMLEKMQGRIYMRKGMQKNMREGKKVYRRRMHDSKKKYKYIKFIKKMQKKVQERI